MSDLVGNPEDRFSHNEAQIAMKNVMHSLHIVHRVTYSNINENRLYLTKTEIMTVKTNYVVPPDSTNAELTSLILTVFISLSFISKLNSFI